MSIHFINQSTVVTAEAFTAFQNDVNAQLNNEFASAWGGLSHIAATLTIVDEPGPNDPAGALGYHDIDASFKPYARVFAKLAAANNISWSVVASHEALEMSANPLVDRIVLLDTSGGAGTSGWLIPAEVCDAVELQSYAGARHSTLLSNFVLPGWYVQGYPGQVDQMKQLAGPLKIASGGYADADFVQQAQGWTNFTAYLTRRSNRKVHFL